MQIGIEGVFMKKLQINWSLWIQGLLFIATAVMVFNAVMNISVIFSAVRSFLSVISAVVMAAVIAYILCRPCKMVEKWISKSKYPIIKKRARGLAVLVVYLIMIAIIYGILSFLFPLLVNNIIDFIDYAPYLYVEIEAFVMGIDWTSIEELFNIEDMNDVLFAGFDVENVIGSVTHTLGTLTNIALSTAAWLFDFSIALIISIYMLLYRDVIFTPVGRVANLIMKRENVQMMKYYILKADDLFYKFIGAQFIDACVMGGLSIILLSVLRVRFAIFLGIFLGVANMIPKFGSIFASFVVIGLTFVTGDINQGIWTTVLLTALQQLDGNVIGPMITGDALKINPILVFFSLIVGAAYFGIIGMFVSIPVVTLVKIIFINIVEAKENKQSHVEQVANKVWQDRYKVNH